MGGRLNWARRLMALALGSKVMNATLHELSGRIRKLEDEVERELKRRRMELHADFEDKKVKFELEVLAAQRRLKRGVLAYIWDSSPLAILTAPLIYAGILPLALLDLFLLLYQTTCFPVYGIKPVQRRDYFAFDRNHLGYLNFIEKINCVYCSYGNGMAAYMREIIGRTEQYWCPIKHARRVQQPHPYYHNFTDFGDAEAYQKELASLRRMLRHAKRLEGI